MSAPMVTFYGPAELQALVRILAKPETWQPAEQITPADVKALRQLMATALMRKLDVVMYNQAQEMMRAAVFAPASEVLAAAKFAAGFKASWEAFKTLSVLPITEKGESGAADDSESDVAE